MNKPLVFALWVGTMGYWGYVTHWGKRTVTNTESNTPSHSHHNKASTDLNGKTSQNPLVERRKVTVKKNQPSSFFTQETSQIHTATNPPQSTTILKGNRSIKQLLTDVDMLDSEADVVLSNLHDLGIQAKATREGHPKFGERIEIYSTDDTGIEIEATYNIMGDGTQEFQSFRAKFSSQNMDEFTKISQQLLKGFSQNAKLTKQTQNILRWEHGNHLVSWARYDMHPEQGYILRMATEFSPYDHVNENTQHEVNEHDL